jgi:hypothetical protein
MSDETYNRVQAERELLSRVDADPRVIAALAAKNAFYDSDAGHHLDEAVHGRTSWSLLDEDIKDAVEAFTFNYYRTRRQVKAELKAEMEAAE